MQLPIITHLQYVILTIILINTNNHDRGSEISGREIRAFLEDIDLEKPLPAFYKIMKRIHLGGWVHSRFQEKEVDGHRIREKIYRITDKGYYEITESYQFYKDQEFIASPR